MKNQFLLTGITVLIFLGFSFGRQVNGITGRSYIGPNPAQKKVQAICDTIGMEASRSKTGRSTEELVTKLNQIMRGWGNYFRMGNCLGAIRVVQQHTCRSLRRWLQKKHGRKGGRQSYPDMKLYEEYGLVNLRRVLVRLPLTA